MIINILNVDYMQQESLYEDFLNNTIEEKYIYRSHVNIELNQIKPFPIYVGVGYENHKDTLMLEAFKTIEEHYLHLDRELLLNQNFWHTLYLTKYRDYVLENYPEVKTSESKFKNIVVKKFDWENYIYKAVIGAQYIKDNVLKVNRDKYYKLIINNLDIYNYIIKYRIFRNDTFLLRILNLIDKDKDLSSILKAKITGREDLGSDERYGRRVIFEFNKSYPIVMSPMMDDKTFKSLFYEYLGKYYNNNR